MKKIISTLLVFAVLMGTIGCGNTNAGNTETAQEAAGTETKTEVKEETKPETTETASEAATTPEPVQTTEEQKVEPVNMSIAVMTGPTAFGMIKVMKDAEDGVAANNYDFQVYETPDEIATKLVKGELDAACVPCNLASTLYNKTKGKIQVAAINTLGVLYIVETGDSIKAVSDLKGKTILSTGQGATPEFTLRYMLKSNGLDPDTDVNIVFYSQAAEVSAVLAKDGGIAMLPQPFVTVVQTQNEKVRIALDVTEEWEKAEKDSTVVTGVLVVRKEFAEENKAAFNELLKEYEKSVEFVNANVSEAGDLVGHFNIFKAPIAKKALPKCNVTYIDGEEMKKKIAPYLQVLFDSKAASVGGALPADDFYYVK